MVLFTCSERGCTCHPAFLLHPEFRFGAEARTRDELVTRGRTLRGCRLPVLRRRGRGADSVVGRFPSALRPVLERRRVGKEVGPGKAKSE